MHAVIFKVTMQRIIKNVYQQAKRENGIIEIPD